MDIELYSDEELLRPGENRFDRVVRRIEEVLFTLIIITMIGIGLAPIVLRYAGMAGLTWTESLSQHMLLWITFLGAGTAIRERSSISIDAAPHLLSVRKRIFLRAFTELVSAVVCGVLVWVSILFVKDTWEFDRNTIAFLNIREWWLQGALPCGFLLLTLRLIIAVVEDLLKAFRMNFEKKVTEKRVNREDSDK
jgi:TRAP-type C4-dicarboxylate transport system permease small subunit